MKICLIRKSKGPFIGLVKNSKALALPTAYSKIHKELKLPAFPSDCFTDTISFIKNFSKIKKILPLFLSLEGQKYSPKDNFISPLSKTRLMEPIPRPGAIYCLARNYTEHILELYEKVMEQDKMVPPIFIKPPTCVTGMGGPVIIPKAGRQIDWEAELAVVIGKKAKYVSPENALEYVFGYTCMIDISERSLKINEREMARGRDKFFDWLNGKWMDTFAPMGPWIVTKDEVGNPQNLNINLSVNGIEKQNANTGQMIFSVAEIISYLSQIATLNPGDIISTGTPSGVGAAKGTFLEDGDLIEMNIEKIGCLKVTVKSERF